MLSRQYLRISLNCVCGQTSKVWSCLLNLQPQTQVATSPSPAYIERRARDGLGARGAADEMQDQIVLVEDDVALDVLVESRRKAKGGARLARWWATCGIPGSC